MRSTITIPTLLAALVAAPLAAIAVFIRWSAIADHWPADGITPAMWSARTFLAYFDIGVAVLFLPSLAVCLRIRKRLEAALSNRRAVHASSGRFSPVVR